MKNRKMLVICIIVVLSFLVGCTNSEFDSNYKQFKESYILATNFLEKDNDSLDALKSMDVSDVENELIKMKKFMDKMNSESKSGDEKGLLENVKIYYQQVEFLLYASRNYNKLSVVEKEKVYLEADLVFMSRKSIKGGEE